MRERGFTPVFSQAGLDGMAGGTGEITMTRDQRVKEILERTGAVLTNDHFVYTSGNHGDAYVNKDAIYPHTQETSEIAEMFAEAFRDANVDVVVGPTMGGVILSHDTANFLTKMTGHEVPGVFAEKSKSEDGSDGFEFTRGYDKFVRGKRVLIVEDILNTGGSVKKVVDLVKATGGEIVGVAAMVNRGGVTAEELGVDRLDALTSVDLKMMSPQDCTLCKDGVSVNTTVGKGKKFLEEKASK